jgi:hypothetical protein
MEEHKLKPFKLRRPLLVGERPTGIIVPWQVWLVFCAIVIIVAGIVGWFPSLVSSACGLYRYYDINFGVLISLSVSAKIERLHIRDSTELYRLVNSASPINESRVK